MTDLGGCGQHPPWKKTEEKPSYGLKLLEKPVCNNAKVQSSALCSAGFTVCVCACDRERTLAKLYTTHRMKTYISHDGEGDTSIHSLTPIFL